MALNWDSMNKARLSMLLARGLTYSDIAKEFGVSRSAISGAAYRLGYVDKQRGDTQEWKTMETAPRDGTPFLYHAYWMNGGKKEVAIAYFMRGKFAVLFGSYKAYPANKGIDGSWMPLPPPPRNG